MKVPEFLRGFTNAGTEVINLSGFMGVLSLIGLSGVHVWRDGQFSPIEFGGGFGAIIAAIGGARRLKDVGVAQATMTMKQANGEPQ